MSTTQYAVLIFDAVIITGFIIYSIWKKSNKHLYLMLFFFAATSYCTVILFVPAIISLKSKTVPAIEEKVKKNGSAPDDMPAEPEPEPDQVIPEPLAYEGPVGYA